jgi:uncharacterized membrane protein YhaH (DUF805 family)
VTCFRKYAVFSGRASRPEFWWFALATLAVYFSISSLLGLPLDILVSYLFRGSLISLAVAVFVLLPLTAAGFRRMHDVGWLGWPMLFPIVMVLTYYPAVVGVMSFGNAANPENLFVFVGRLISLVVAFGTPVVCILAMIVLSLPSKPCANKYGPNSLEDTP